MLPDLAIDRHPPIVTPDTVLTDALAIMCPGNQSGQTQSLKASIFGVPADGGEDSANGVATDADYVTDTDYVLVMAGPTLVGVLTVRDVVQWVAQGVPLATVSVAEVMQSSVITLRRSQCEDVFNVITLFKQHHIRHLPILDDDDRLVGVATPQTIQRAPQLMDLLRWQRVDEVMAQPVITACPTASLQAVIQRMATHRISCVVITAEAATPTSPPSIPLGMITERDIVRFYLLGLNLATIEAQVVMSTPVFTITPAASLWQAHTLMQTHRVRRLAVVAGGEVVGLVTQSTILRSLDATALYTIVQSLTQRLATLEATTTAQIQQLDALLKQRTEARDRALYKQQQAIAVLQKQNEQLAAITHTIPGLVYQAELGQDGQMLLTYLSAGIEDLSGYPLEQFQTHPAALFDLIHPDDRDRCQQHLSASLETLEPSNDEFRIVTATGQVKWVENRARYGRLPTGDVQVNGLVLDISNLKRIEQSLGEAVSKLRSTNQTLEQWVAERTAALSQQNKKLEAIFQAFPDILLRLDAQGRYLEVKCHNEADLYVPAKAMLGRTVREILPSPLGQQMSELIQLTLKSQQVQRLEHTLQLGDTPRYFEARCIPLGSQQVIAIIRDISDRKRTEEALQRQAEQDRLLARLFFRMRQTLNLEDILQVTVEEVREFLGVDRVLVYRFQANWCGDILVEAVAQPYLHLQGQSIHDPCFPGSWVGQYQVGRVAVVEDVETAAIAPCYADFLRQLQIRANLVVPIHREGTTLWGLLIAHHCTAPRPWRKREIDLLRQIAGHLGTAIQQADLYARLQAELAERRRTEAILEQQICQEKVLHALSQQIRQPLDLDRILATTVREVHQLLQADRVLIFRLYPDEQTHVIEESVTPGLPELRNFKFVDEVFLEACATFYRQGNARIVPNVVEDEWSACIADFMRKIGVKSRMVAPILVGEDSPHTSQLWGLLIVHACHDRQWQHAELALLQRLATQVGIAIQQANLYNRLANELAQKEVLLKEIHHRVKNNLQIISSLLSWQVDMIEDPQVLRIIKDSQSRIAAMAMIHERMYQSPNLAQMAFDEYLYQLVSYAFSVYGRPNQGIHLQLAIEPVSLNLETALPCGLIAYELVTNALEHAFPDQRSGTVRVALRRLNETQYQLTVQDDGIGFPADLDFRQTNSMGLQLVCGLTQQIKGQITLHQDTGSLSPKQATTDRRGTQFQLTFAEVHYEHRA
ncbi:GAF domain-containing protein [Trichothermofontia sp.]